MIELIVMKRINIFYPAMAGTGIIFMVFCAALLMWLLFAQTQYLLSDPELLMDFFSALWEVLSGASIGVLLSLVVYFMRQKDR